MKIVYLDENFERGTLRISLGKYNTEDDAEGMAKALIKTLL